jgi:hypothetical protein
VVGGVFALLLALGLTLGFLIHRRYVAFERVVALHVPPDAAVIVRWDVEKVTLFEPTRRYLLPLLDVRLTGGSGEVTRSERVRQATGLSIGRDLREAMVVFGPQAGQWATVLGGSFPSGDLLPSAEPVLRDEGFRFATPEKRALLGPRGLLVSQVDEGAYAGASDERSLLGIAERRSDPAVPRTGAGTFVARLDRPGVPDFIRAALAVLGEVGEVHAAADWGKPLPVDVTLHFVREVPADISVRFRRVLELLLFDHVAVLERTYGPIRLQPAGNLMVKGRVRLDDTALEIVADQAKSEVLARIGARYGQK